VSDQQDAYVEGPLRWGQFEGSALMGDLSLTTQPQESDPECPPVGWEGAVFPGLPNPVPSVKQ
jgi:hypothetical protein